MEGRLPGPDPGHGRGPGKRQLRPNEDLRGVLGGIFSRPFLFKHLGGFEVFLGLVSRFLGVRGFFGVFFQVFRG